MVLLPILLLIVLIGLLLLWGQLTSRGRLPPGPRPLPFLGNILHLDHKGFHKSLQAVRWGWQRGGEQDGNGWETAQRQQSRWRSNSGWDLADQLGDCLLPAVTYPNLPTREASGIPVRKNGGKVD
ncbi:hypothetical protein HPG69_018078 [Diceros bicornis minor]|uniref:Uncharacterized protein n=1 Tax=Diceros bicornis minor TaxID=77932 RepID=A0A7J7F8W7_DICBM|nr:hypothetical protein HPG69_018078 [Diceros bicornis minor]